MNHQMPTQKQQGVCIFFISFFSTADFFFKTIYLSAQMAHLVLPDTQADPSAKPKSHFLPTHNLKTEITKQQYKI
jgi:hypothetical protein